MASVAMRMLPSVPFLKPIGAEMPEASSRWTWLSVGAGTNRAPADQVPDVLGRDHVQKFAGRGHAQAVDVDEQLAGDAQAFVDAVAAVQVGVVDQALPADGGAGLFKIHAHHDFQRVFVLLAHVGQAAGVVQRGLGVVDGAGADDDQQAVILVAHDALDALRVCR